MEIKNSNMYLKERKDYVIPLTAYGEPYPKETIDEYKKMDGAEFWSKWGDTDESNILELIDLSVLVTAEDENGDASRKRFAELTMSMLPSVVSPMRGLNLIDMGLMKSMKRASFTATPIFPIVFCGWGGEEADCQTFAIYPKSFEMGYIEVMCDKRGVEIAEDVCSGLKVVAWNDDSAILEVDDTLVKNTIPFGHNGDVNTNFFGGYAFSIREYGEFLIEVYFKPKKGCEMDKVLLFSYNFCCK